MSDQIQIIKPTWKAPKNVRGFTTTRLNGFSPKPFDSLNTGLHVGDDALLVHKNRLKIQNLLPSIPAWLDQVHSNRIVTLSDADSGVVEADGSLTSSANQVCAIQTADCLPVLVTDTCGNQVAALHAGWRSLAAEIIVKAIEKFEAAPNNILIWLGPAIGPTAFEVGNDVFSDFVSLSSAYEACFIAKQNGKFFFDIYRAAKVQCELNGVYSISGGDYCTYNDPERFFSYRRDGQTGRMLTVIWKTT